MKQSIKLVGVLAALALGTSACANDDTAPSGSGSTGCGEGPLKIGVIVPLSGPAGPNGEDVLEAIQVGPQGVAGIGDAQRPWVEPAALFCVL